MTNKALRILIADEQHFQRMNIERLLNQLDYYCIAPVQNIEEWLLLVEYASEPFDLLLINASLTEGALDLLAFLRDNRQVRHAFIYNGLQAQLPPIPACEQPRVQVSLEALPDLPSIQRLMAHVERRLS